MLQWLNYHFSSACAAADVHMHRGSTPIVAPTDSCAHVNTSGGWWFLKLGRKDCELCFHGPACAVSGVWWHKDVRIKLFQGVLVNCKKHGGIIM